MKLLFLSFYYEPDLSACSFRSKALTEALLKKKEGNLHIDVFTTLPNRYATYSADAPEVEEKKCLSIHRLALPDHKSGMYDQVKAFLHFYRFVVRMVKDKEYDMVYATSSRLFTAFLGARIANKKRLPLYLDIRDIFVDTMSDVLSSKFFFLLAPVLNLIESYTLRSAIKLNLVSEGFSSYFSHRYPDLLQSYFTNGIDEEFIQTSNANDSFRDNVIVDKKTILYAGNIGEGQGLHKIIPPLAAKLGSDYRIVIIGDGGRKQMLRSELSKLALDNVKILPPVPRTELIEHYKAASILCLHLNDYEAFKKVLPSKVFEYAVFNKPILAGVSGYAANFIKRELECASVFEPGNVDQAIDAINSMSEIDINNDEFIRKYQRKNIMLSMADDILALVSKSS